MKKELYCKANIMHETAGGMNIVSQHFHIPAEKAGKTKKETLEAVQKLWDQWAQRESKLKGKPIKKVVVSTISKKEYEKAMKVQ